ncbi:MAG: PAS domain S-box protein [Acidobacteria bacterium]|nr:PAS domain S-box protein [Acidobacteriota bacterium]
MQRQDPAASSAQWSIRRAEVLSETAARLLESDDPQAIVEELCRRVMDLLDCQAFFNYLADDSAGRLYLNACAGIPDEAAREAANLDYGVAVCGCVALARQRIIAEDIQNADDSRTELVKSFGIQAYCCHPLKVRERLIGTLSFGTRTRANFTSEQIDVMKAVADLVAIAMYRIETETALRRSESLLRAVMDSCPEPIFLKDSAGRILLANPAACAVIGKPAELVIGRDDNELYDDPVLGRAIMENDRRIMDSGQTQTVEETTPGRDGPRVYLSTKTPFRDAGGRVVGIVGQSRDITERKRAEEALRESVDKHRSAFANAAIGFAMTDPDGKFVDANPAYCRLTGYTLDELRDLSLQRLFHSADAAQNLQLIDGMLRGEIADFVIENRYVRKDGGAVWVRKSVAVVRTTEGAPRWLVALVEDVTQRKRAEEALQESRNDLDRAQEVGQIGSWRLDVRSNVLRWSDENHRIFGIPKGTPLTYDTFLGCVHPDDRQYVDESWSDGLKGEPYDIEHRIVVDGQVKWVRERAYLEWDETGGLLGGFGITQDITERKAAEQELRRTTDELRRSNEELRQFGYAASHDLQEPLRMVTSFLRLLEQRYDGQLDAKAREYIRFAVDGAARMSQLISDLLEYNRVERAPRELKPTDTAAALADALANVRAAIADADATVTVDPLPTVKCDRTQLTLLFQNLVGNAVKFRSPQRRCTVHVGARRTKGEWEFSVRDNGIGIDPRHRDNLFVIFQRLHARESYPGTGIGLAICKKIVERHGGRIWLTSVVGEGTTFCFTLPG